MSSWSLVYEKFEPEKESLREALCTLGNGYFVLAGEPHYSISLCQISGERPQVKI